MSVIAVHPKNYGHHHHENDPESTADKFAKKFTKEADTFIKAVESSGNAQMKMNPYSVFIKNYKNQTLRVSFHLELWMNPTTRDFDIHVVWFCEDNDGRETKGNEPSGATLRNWDTRKEAYGEGREKTLEVVYNITHDLLKNPDGHRNDEIQFGTA